MKLTLLKYVDWKLFVIVCLIISLGLATLFSLTFSQENPDYTRLTKQLVALALGLILFFVLVFTNYKLFSAAAWILYGLGNLLLILVLFFGQTIRGTTGWFVFFGFNFQPVEIIKVILVIILAHFFAKNIDYRDNWKGWVFSFLLILPPSLLSALQPDLGPVLIFIVLWLTFVLLIQTNRKFIWWFVILAVLISFIGWNYVLSDYHKDRLHTFVNPEADPLGQGYNIRQSIIAIGSGMLIGRGLGLGTQSQLHFLPEAATDFIFAVIAEELGLLGVVILVGLFVLLFQHFYQATRQIKEDFGQFLLIGFTVILFIQILINIAMNLGLVPVAGLALPFVSYGGSYLLISLSVVGIIENVIIFAKKSI